MLSFQSPADLPVLKKIVSTGSGNIELELKTNVLTYEALFDEDASNSVNGLNASNSSKYALFTLFCALLNSASMEVLNPTFPRNLSYNPAFSDKSHLSNMRSRAFSVL